MPGKRKGAPAIPLQTLTSFHDKGDVPGLSGNNGPYEQTGFPASQLRSGTLLSSSVMSHNSASSIARHKAQVKPKCSDKWDKIALIWC
jgi:hypothetical protein